jgi:hypothetical protein
MATWDEVRKHLRAHYLLVVEEADWVGMEWTFHHDEKVVTQRVKVARVVAFGADWVLVFAAVCDADKLAALSALRFNARLPIGSLAVEHDRCYLRAALPLDTLSFGDLDRTVTFVARETARLREPELPGEKQASTFAHYDD